MGANLYYKKYIEKMIAENPQEIIIKRRTEGGLEEIPPQTVLFYNRKAHRETVEDSGRTIAYGASSVPKLLTKGDSVIEEGDMFTHDDKVFRVTFVKSYKGICKQAELEVASYD